MSGPPAFEFIEDVTSDLSFVARGRSLEQVFAAAAEALLAATVDDPGRIEPREQRPLALAEPDRELLLLAFLNELVYLRDAERLLLRPRNLRISVDAEARLEGELVGEVIDPARHRLLTDVKAATAHGLRLLRDAGGWRATVTVDV